jgi:hypothetical protein
VEIMAPIFQMGFFEGLVRPTLYNAFTGWGLDFVWPFMMRYPRRRVAVLDEICMVHSAPSGSKGGGEGDLYTVPVPYDEREEEARRMAEYGYYASRVEAMGLPFRNMQTLGEVAQTWFSADEVPAPAEGLVSVKNIQQEVGDARLLQEDSPAGAGWLVGAGAGLAAMACVAAAARKRGRKGRRAGARAPKQPPNTPSASV